MYWDDEVSGVLVWVLGARGAGMIGKRDIIESHAV